MGSRVDKILWAWIILDSWVCSTDLPEIRNQKFIDECLREHNKARSSVNPPATDMLYMTWDEGLAVTARAWARHCLFDHNPRLREVRLVHPNFSSVGENIWTGHPPLFDVTTAIGRWVGEKKDYNYEKNTCTANEMCGHYTQVVWGSSYKVGCAAHLCPGGVRNFDSRKAVMFVCNYATAGNMNGNRPYVSGREACSGCTGTCDNRLCRDKERDSQKSYNWTPDWDPDGVSQQAADFHYVIILVVRPIGLIFTFITAYGVHWYYPNIFCYE
ncbi:GLIPR1-like protein 1 [Echeneis naucrates]|uniref:SCP domain-containing protein n=1 Tax=Echeneis naucrates TaxID=173247 RepID=A0A665VN72_ECHNA|nr:glioma pathogenesis-related protein 1 [Echeneis naucrates]